MSAANSDVLNMLSKTPRRWLVTGAAGFIGSNIVETLLRNGQTVVGLDNFFSGHRKNIDHILQSLPASAQKHWTFFEGDIRDRAVTSKAAAGVDIICHQAAIGSVPRSIEDPVFSHDVNVNGFVSILEAARLHGIKRFVYASSSSVYGDDPKLPKAEENVGNPLSPYAATKRINELYARAYSSCYGVTMVGLRYFNVFGPRQDPNGPYAAVIPGWVSRMLTKQPVEIYGTGETSRDFCFVSNVVDANIRSGLAELKSGSCHELNIAAHHQTSLNQLFAYLKTLLAELTQDSDLAKLEPIYKPFRKGDILHSLANINHARETIGYEPKYGVREGLEKTMPWYCESFGKNAT